MPSRREFLAVGAGSALAQVQAGSAAVCRIVGAGGDPLPAHEVQRLYVCDSMLRPFPVVPDATVGQAQFRPPGRPFRIGLKLTVPGFGNVCVYADNRGRGYAPGALQKPLLLNYEFAADRIAAVRNAVDQCNQSGIPLPPGPLRRIEQAEALLGKALSAGSVGTAAVKFCFASLAEALWAGEEVVLERARQRIVRNGPRPGFLFGCNAFGYPRLGRPYADCFEALFNFATLPCYWSLERVHYRPDFRNLDSIVAWIEGTRLIAKGHPLMYFKPGVVPAWLDHRPFEQARDLAADYARRIVRRYRHRVHTWDVINEEHLQNALGFTPDQQLEITRAATRAAREADPTCCRIVNNCCTWSDYMRQPKPGQQSVHEYVTALQDGGVDFEVLGLQYYRAGRDMLEIERSIETFRDFGKSIHITELGTPSSSEPLAESRGEQPGPAWHGEAWTEQSQADWVEQFYTIAYSKPYIHAITWWDLADPGYIAHGGLVRPDLSPKESYTRLNTLIENWRRMERG